MKSIHISIGIPAYNEGKNIERLLRTLEKQYLWGISIDEIIVISDGSTDNTQERIQSVDNSKIRFIRHLHRIGINATINQIFTLSKSPVLVLLNADVDIANKAFLHELIHPFRIIRNLGIVGANVMPLRPRNYFERVLSVSHLLKKDAYDRYNQGQNIYNCHGRGRALSRKLYAGMQIPDNCPEDSYAYFRCISKGYIFHYQPDAIVRFRSPQNFADHVKQSIRFTQGKSSLTSYFDDSLVNQQYAIPSQIIIGSLLRFIIRYPGPVLSYALIQFIIHAKYKRTIIDQTLFDPAESSKALI